MTWTMGQNNGLSYSDEHDDNGGNRWVLVMELFTNISMKLTHKKYSMFAVTW